MFVIDITDISKVEISINSEDEVHEIHSLVSSLYSV